MCFKTAISKSWTFRKAHKFCLTRLSSSVFFFSSPRLSEKFTQIFNWTLFCWWDFFFFAGKLQTCHRKIIFSCFRNLIKLRHRLKALLCCWWSLEFVTSCSTNLSMFMSFQWRWSYKLWDWKDHKSVVSYFLVSFDRVLYNKIPFEKTHLTQNRSRDDVDWTKPVLTRIKTVKIYHILFVPTLDFPFMEKRARDGNIIKIDSLMFYHIPRNSPPNKEERKFWILMMLNHMEVTENITMKFAFFEINKFASLRHYLKVFSRQKH